jgi:hypothetical protein
MWHADLSAVFMRTLGHAEVIMRNAMNQQLVVWSTTTFGEPRWYRDPERVFLPSTTKKITEALSSLEFYGYHETTNAVVSELSFGFWRYLLSARYADPLWRGCLFRAFPGAAGRRQVVAEPMARLNRLRNRIAHHEPIHRFDLVRLREEALFVAEMVDPVAREWIEGQCDVPRLLALRPAGALWVPDGRTRTSSVPRARPAGQQTRAGGAGGGTDRARP